MVAGGHFGLPDRGDGACGHLSEDNKCKIYDKRPDICRVDKMYEIRNPSISRKEYYIENSKACHTLIDRLKLDKSYKIELKEYERK